MSDDVPVPMHRPEGVCVFCKTLTVKAVVVRQLIPGMIPIIGPGSCHQYQTVTTGYHCTTCGLRYEFPTKLSQP